MQNVYFTPGPTHLYPTVPIHLQTALKTDILAISHRDPAYVAMAQATVTAVRTLFNIPADYQVFFLSSGTEAMERVIENTVEKTSFHFVDGDFSLRFQETSRDLGKHALMYQVPNGQGFDYTQASIPAEAEVICLTHNETSTGVMLNMADVYALKAQHSDKLMALDVVSSAPYVDIDFTRLDMVFFSVQKGFGLPAGLAVLVVSPQAMAKSVVIQNHVPQTYHSFSSLQTYATKFQTPETPNVLDIFLLGQVCTDMLQTSLTTIRQQTEIKFEQVQAVVARSKILSYFVQDQVCCSKTVIVLDVKGGSKLLIKDLADQGLIVGTGYKQYKDQQIRIANFPSHSLADFNRLVQALAIYAPKV